MCFFEVQLQVSYNFLRSGWSWLWWPKWWASYWLLLTANLHPCCCYWISAIKHSFRHSRPPSPPSMPPKNCSAWWLGTWLAAVVSYRSWTFRCSGWSPTVKLSAGIPQESVLRPLLFTTFRIPIGKLINSHDLCLYRCHDWLAHQKCSTADKT